MDEYEKVVAMVAELSLRDKSQLANELQKLIAQDMEDQMF